MSTPAVHHHGEMSPLLLKQGSTYSGGGDDEESSSESSIGRRGGGGHHVAAAGRATVQETVANLMKTCMGSGCLALPYAASRGGIVLYTIGLLLIALWNIYSVQRLCRCLAYTPIGGGGHCDHATLPVESDDDEEEEEPNSDNNNNRGAPATTARITFDRRSLFPSRPPPAGTATFGQVAWYSFGPAGLEAVDIALLCLLFGVNISYVSAVLSFMEDTPFTTGRVADATVTGVILGCLSLVPNVGMLSHASAAGLVVLLAAFLVIAAYGIVAYDPATAASLSSIKLWPSSLTEASHWFGCVVFGFGTVPLTYNFRESMAEPRQIVYANQIALIGVALAYIAAGVGLYLLFPTVSDEILHALPQTGFLPIATRLAMVAVVLTTAPLLLIPTAELLEGKWHHVFPSLCNSRATVRFGVCGACCVVAVLLPSFVQALSLVGCASVAFVGFCVPPALHLRLSYKAATLTPPAKAIRMNRAAAVADVLLLTWGCFATVVGTIYIFGKVTTT